MTVVRFQGEEKETLYNFIYILKFSNLAFSILLNIGSDMVTATRRKGGLGFLQQRLRLNVAITRPHDTLFVIADIQATLDQIPVNKLFAEGEELDPEFKGQDMVELQQGQNILKKIVEFYVSQKCVRLININILESTYVSLTKPNNLQWQDIIELQQAQNI